VQLTADFSLSRLIKKYITDLFAEKKVSEENSKKLFLHYNEKLGSGLDIGYSTKLEFYDKELATNLAANIAEFSAFKEASFANTLKDLLKDGEKLVPWKDFKEAAYLVDSDYNQRYLQTEYDQTIANAQSAAKWNDFQRNKELYPNLIFRTVGDDRVRPEHEVLNGTIKPINDPFWDANFPPLDWGCRCDAEQTDEDPTSETPEIPIKDEFDNNPGKSGKIFNEDSGYRLTLTDAEVKATEANLKKWQEEE
jgi:SPP1 gp7 family putative phage head morphogenesis protein